MMMVSTGRVCFRTRYRVEPSCIEGMAATEAAGTQVNALDQAVPVNSFFCIV
jgi:hypothetical protein